jgi:Retroviral aspartyl protease
MADLIVPYRDLGLGDARPYLVLTVTGPDGTKRGPIPGLIDTGADGTVLPAGYAPLMGYTAADIVGQQGTQVGGSVTMWRATRPSRAFIPEIPGVVFDLNPCFVQGSQIALWGRGDLMHHFEVSIAERRKEVLPHAGGSVTSLQVGRSRPSSGRAQVSVVAVSPTARLSQEHTAETPAAILKT